MKIMKIIRDLCTPAYVYLILSVISLIAMMFQNVGNTSIFCLGNYSCNVPNTGAVFVGQVIYIAFWTFILNAVCKAGYKNFSWFLVLFPFILMFVALGLVLIFAAEIEMKSLIN